MSLLIALSASTYAASDLETTLQMPSGKDVYETQKIKATVENIGSSKAKNTTVTFELPETGTSPSVYVMGDLGAMHSKCSQSGTEIVCNVRTVKPGKKKTVWFEIDVPWTESALSFTAKATTTSSEDSTSNNDDSDVAEVSFIDTLLAGGEAMVNSHCSGTGLTAYYECTLFPSPITDHNSVHEADGSITFPDFAGYGGSWWQDSDDHLAFEYTYGGSVVAEFEGNGVGDDCFEGLTTFPGSAYVAPYEVCF